MKWHEKLGLTLMCGCICYLSCWWLAALDLFWWLK